MTKPTAESEWLANWKRRLAPARVDRPIGLCRTAHFELLFRPGQIEDCPERDPHRQMHLYARRLEELRARFLVVSALPESELPASRPTVAIVAEAVDCERLAASLLGVEAQGIGNWSGTRGVLVVRHDAALPDDAALHRQVVHGVVHLLLAPLQPAGSSLDESGWGWLEEGLAHWFEADLGGGVCECLCHLGRVQEPVRYWGGRWRTAARELLEAEELPALRDVAAREVIDLDLAGHVTAFALVDYWTCQPAAVVTPERSAAVPPLLRILRAAKAGKRSDEALPAGDAFWTWVKATYPRR